MQLDSEPLVLQHGELPSQGYQNAPMSVVKSYTSGRAVLNADRNAIPELINDEVAGCAG
jgi:hypothetical protein